VNEINDYIDDLNHIVKGRQFSIQNFNAKKDIRAKLLNEGIKLSQSRYLCFLDYDDIIYENFIPFHLNNLKKKFAISVGAVRSAHLKIFKSHPYYIMNKKPFYGKKIKYSDQIVENRIPIHSFMIDTSKINKKDLYINEKMLVLEDYEFLLRLQAQYMFNFGSSETCVCEYRFRDDNSNSTAYFDTTNDRKINVWKKSRSKITKLKNELKSKHSFYDIAQMDEGTLAHH